MSDEIVVTGAKTRLTFEDYSWTWGTENYGALAFDTIFGWDGGGGGRGGGGIVVTAPSPDTKDAEVDALAKQIAQEIVVKGQTTHEWGAIIWRDDAGNLHRTAVVEGTDTNVDVFGNTAETDGHVNYTTNQIVAVIHSHPDFVISNTYGLSAVNVSANYLSAGDYGWLKYLGDYGNQAQDPRMYLVHGGTMTEYDWSNNHSVDTSSGTATDAVASSIVDLHL